MKLLPGFPLAYIGWSLAYASALYPVPNMNFNLLTQSVAGPCGNRFLQKAKKSGRAVFVWTVNDVSWMEWSIQKGLDGVITDDPKLFLEVCDRWKNGPNQLGTGTSSNGTNQIRWKLRQLVEFVIFFTLLAIALPIVMIRKGTPRNHVKRALGNLA